MTNISVHNVSKHFGGVKVLNDVSITAEKGRVTALIGPNGAGKSTLANVVSGYTRPNAGTVSLGEKDVTRLPTHQRAKLGLGRTFQNLELFHGMSVQENVVLGRYTEYSPFSRWFRGPSREDIAAVAATVGNLGLGSYSHQDAGALSFGQAKMVEPARVLAMQPRAIVMDEPAAGLTAVQTSELGDWIVGVARSGVAVLIIEHNMRLIMEIADYIYVLDSGSLIAEGTPAEISGNQLVLDAYLGVAAE
jgi:branched-chain amino acid transport system ATP-binding protein